MQSIVISILMLIVDIDIDIDSDIDITSGLDLVRKVLLKVSGMCSR